MNTICVKVPITPQELRRAADHIEFEWRRTWVGDDLPIYRISNDGIEIVFIANQDEMPKR